MSKDSEDSRAADHSNYLEIFEQFFDQADGLCSNENTHFSNFTSDSQFPLKKQCADLNVQCHKKSLKSVNPLKDYHHEPRCAQNTSQLHNRENVLKTFSSRKNTAPVRRGVLKRQNGFNDDDGFNEGVVQESKLDILEDEVFDVPDCQQNDHINYNPRNTHCDSNVRKSNKVINVLNGNRSNCKSKSTKTDIGNRRTSVPLQPINVQNNQSSPICKHQQPKKSQSFKHSCTKYYVYPKNNNARISLVLPTKQRRFKTPMCTDNTKVASLRPLENNGKNRHHSFEQSKQHIDPAQKKLQLVRLMQNLDCTVVRTFVTSSKGVVNRGDSFRKKVPQVTPDVVVGCLPYLLDDKSSLLGRNDSIDLLASSEPRQASKKPQSLKQVNEQSQVFNVLVLGDQSVGKTSMLQQFITSEFMASADPVFDKEFEKRVSVQVDDQETTLAFVDLPIKVQKKGLPFSDTDAFLVCYSITDRESFEWAVEAVQAIRQRSEAALILVANKSDLVRSRKVGFEESRAVCQRHNCKFVEVSAAFNHRVDELLVGLVHQIRLNSTRQRAKSVPNATGSTLSTDSLLSSKSSQTAGCFRGAKVFLTEFILGFRKTKSRSCDNLWTL